MLKQVNAEVETVAAVISHALEGLKHITFTLDVYIRRTAEGRKDLVIYVTMWFGHHFSQKVTGGDDIEWLAKECREEAIRNLSKIHEIAKANDPELTG
jgi:hypothetical protein